MKRKEKGERRRHWEDIENNNSERANLRWRQSSNDWWSFDEDWSWSTSQQSHFIKLSQTFIFKMSQMPFENIWIPILLNLIANLKLNNCLQSIVPESDAISKFIFENLKLRFKSFKGF